MREKVKGREKKLNVKEERKEKNQEVGSLGDSLACQRGGSKHPPSHV